MKKKQTMCQIYEERDYQPLKQGVFGNVLVKEC